MSTRNLKHLFRPRSVAVIGASEIPRSPGATLLRNLVDAGFDGTVLPVNPKYRELAGIKVYRTVASLPEVPELAVICTPPVVVPAVIAELGKRGTKAAIVTTAGLEGIDGRKGTTLNETMLGAARPHLLRVLGPSCVGLLVPGIGLNASLAPTNALTGTTAFVSQSGALTNAVLDWAKPRGIGFSKFICLGESVDVDCADVLDYLGSDPETRTILLHLEAIRAARKFMSAARAAARNKPVLVVKSGRTPGQRRADASFIGELASPDDVHDAAFRRAGMLRVFSTKDLFDALETLARARPLAGDRLTIMTNGRGPGAMALDALIGTEASLASPSKETLRNLDAIVPISRVCDNPVDILDDAPAERYVRTLHSLLDDPQSDAVLFIHAPTAVVSSAEIATAVAPVVKASRRNVLACWLGGDAARHAREAFGRVGIPTYDTPEDGVRTFARMVQYRRNQNMLMEVPPSRSAEFVHDRDKAHAVVAGALADGRTLLSETEAHAVLAAYGVAVADTRIASTPGEAVAVARAIGFPVALKVRASDVVRRSDVGGVALDLESPAAVEAGVKAIIARMRKHRPDVTPEGFIVQAMVRQPHAHQLVLGATTDAVFGPVIVFGQGGSAAGAIADHAVALPPLNAVLARDLIARTRVATVLAGDGNHPPADLVAVARTLIQLAQLVADIPEIVDVAINPLVADERGVLAREVCMQVAPSNAAGLDRFAIRPYPEELEERVQWQGQSVLLRPIRPEDGTQHIEFFNALEPEDVHYRVFSHLRELQGSQLARLTQIDYDREMAFVAVGEPAPGRLETLGVVRAFADPDNISAEFAIIVRSDLKGRGLGPILFGKLVDYCRSRGIREIVGETLADNQRLIGLVRRFGAALTHPEAGIVAIRIDVRSIPASS